MDSISSIRDALKQLLRTWWRQDRIRVSRCCGQLLSLRVGDRLLIDDKILMVVELRDAFWGERNPTHIEYGVCDWSEESDKPHYAPDQLIVPIPLRDTIQLLRAQDQRELLAEQIVILPRVDELSML